MTTPIPSDSNTPVGGDATVREILPGVCYRQGKPTVADYNEAITDLLCARRQLKSGDMMGCEVCGDSGHASQDGCHHDPLILARQWTAAESVWACWHCGFTATTAEAAREHFGPNEFHLAACQQLGADAADYLDRYAAFIRTVKADDLEMHPYLPEVERVANDLRVSRTSRGTAIGAGKSYPKNTDISRGHTADCPHAETRFPWACDCHARAAEGAPPCV